MENIIRELPIVKFGKDEFYCDTRLSEFRLKGPPYNSISFDELTEIFDDSSLLSYDQNTKDVYRYYDVKMPLPDHVLIIRLPPVRLLDPVGLAIWGKLERDTFIRKGNTFFSISNKKIKERYGIKEPIKRVVPKFGLLDRTLKEKKFKTKKR